MKTTLTYIQRAALLLLLSTISHPLSVLAQGTAFTYQGRLNNNGATTSGLYDMQFAVLDAAAGGFQIGGTLTTNAVVVSNGLFTVTLDFGANVFTGANRWLNLAVKTNGAVSFTPLTPSQQITAAPYAITAGTVTGVIPAASLSGLYTGPVTMNNPGNVFNGALFAGVFTGNGAGLTSVNASTLGGLSSAAFWKTNGNSGANPTNGAFLGTTDNLPLEFRVNGARALRLEPVPGSTNEVNVIGGSVGNRVTSGAYGATVWGGGFDGTNNHGNTVAGNFGTVSGGRQNSANNAETTVAGGRANTATGANSTISGGYANTVSGAYGSIAGGVFNSLTGADDAAIGGGYQNTIQSNSTYATISGGGSNIILTNADRGTIGGGIVNTVGATEGTVSGGAFNSALAFSSTIGGGGGNAASGGWSTIAGGRANLVTNADYATIGGGYQNTIQPNSPYATIGGGVANTIQTNADTAMIGGGHNNTIQSAAHSAIVGGGYNVIQSNAHDSMIGGGGYNTIQTNAHSSFIGGGGVNTIQSDAFYAVIGGGYQNTIQTNDFYSAIVGGGANTIQNFSGGSVIGGGLYNVIQSNAYNATLGGGYQNTVQANAPYATIPGGFGNSAANLAFAAGTQAKANHTGAFVWADSTFADFVSTANNQFLIRAGGGVGINKNNPATALDVSGTVTATGFTGSGAGLTGLNAASLSGSVPSASLTSVPAGNLTGSVPSASLTSVPAASLTGTISDARLSSNVALRAGGNAFTGTQTITGGNLGLGITPLSTLHVNGTERIEGGNNWDVTSTEGDFRVGTDSFRFKIGVANGGGGSGDVWMRAHGGTARVFIKTPGGTTFYSNEGQTAGVSLAAGGTAWAVVSDRNVKKDFAAVDSAQILEKLAAMPITQWHYKWETSDITPHIGPMAQDFKAAFYPGTDDKSITTQEADGVALAAIQGLNEKLEGQLKQQRTENAELKRRLDALEKIIRHQKTN